MTYGQSSYIGYLAASVTMKLDSNHRRYTGLYRATGCCRSSLGDSWIYVVTSAIGFLFSLSLQSTALDTKDAPPPPARRVLWLLSSRHWLDINGSMLSVWYIQYVFSMKYLCTPILSPTNRELKKPNCYTRCVLELGEVTNWQCY